MYMYILHVTRIRKGEEYFSERGANAYNSYKITWLSITLAETHCNNLENKTLSKHIQVATSNIYMCMHTNNSVVQKKKYTCI